MILAAITEVFAPLGHALAHALGGVEIPYPHFDPVAFRIPTFGLFGLHGLPIRWYGLAYMAGVIAAWAYLGVLIARPRLWGPPAIGPFAPRRETIDDLGFWAIFGIILGGRIGYVLFYKPDMIWLDPGELPQLWNGGMSFHGGFLGVALVAALVSRAHKTPLMTIADLCAAAAPFGLFFGRIANFVNGELYGRPTNVAWAMRFPLPDGSGGLTEPRHPSQLYEAGLEGIAMAAILAVAVWRFKSFRRPGLTAGLFVMLYGVFRMSMEQFRQPDAHMPAALQGIITMGGLLSLPMVLVGLFLVLRARPTTPPPAAPPVAA